MRLTLLAVCGAIASLVFLTMMVAVGRNRAAHGGEESRRTALLSEYAWAVVPWVFMVGCALPAVIS